MRIIGGTGLGLAICQRIADAHGATIIAESTPQDAALDPDRPGYYQNHRVVFTVRIPLIRPLI